MLAERTADTSMTQLGPRSSVRPAQAELSRKVLSLTQPRRSKFVAFVANTHVYVRGRVRVCDLIMQCKAQPSAFKHTYIQGRVTGQITGLREHQINAMITD